MHEFAYNISYVFINKMNWTEKEWIACQVKTIIQWMIQP